LDANTNPIGSPREMNNIEPQKILNKPHYKLLIAEWLLFSSEISTEDFGQSMDWKFSDIKNRFSVFESYVNLAANLLEKIGYHREKKENSRSRLHDVSHIIYGAYCDVFVSADKKMIKKTKAIYSMLEIPTKVLDLNEFYDY
jgi:hypothetical protein